MDERWLDIQGYDGRYQVSDRGRVRNASGRILKANVNNHGYEMVQLFTDKKVKHCSVHRLVALAFSGISPDQLVNHMDKNRLNNHYSNLEACTPRENSVHYYGNEFPGTSRNKNGKRWISQITINGRVRHLGTFDTQEEAHKAYLGVLKGNGIENKYAKGASNEH